MGRSSSHKILQRSQEDCGTLSSYDIVGDIAVVRVPRHFPNEIELIAKDLMQSHRNVKTVLRQVGEVSGDLRLRRLEWIAGDRKLETVHREFGCVFKVDLEKCYFSPRLSHERMRIAELVAPDETIVNMFAGVGSFSVLIGCHSRVKKVFSIDVNPFAVKLMRENARLNRVESKVIPILGDAKDVVRKSLPSVADRVVMPLPGKALVYLKYALMALKPSGGWIHYYSFEHAFKHEAPVEKAKTKVEQKLGKLGICFRFSGQRVVRSTGPNWYQIALDIHVIGKSKPRQS